MYKIRKSKKAMTLLELLIALAIMSIIMPVVFSFFMSNYRTVNKTSIKSELQYDAEVSMKYINKSAMEASNISKINDITSTKELEGLGKLQESIAIDSNLELIVNSQETIKTEDTINPEATIYRFELDENGTLSYSYGLAKDRLTWEPIGKPIGKNIESFKITPLGDKTNFVNCYGIKVDLNFKKDHIPYGVSNNIVFRNK